MVPACFAYSALEVQRSTYVPNGESEHLFNVKPYKNIANKPCMRIDCDERPIVNIFVQYYFYLLICVHKVY